MVTKTGNTSLSRIYRDRMRDIHISIPETLDANIREFILTTYHGYEKGAISSVVIEAIRMYLDPGTHTQKRKSTRYSNHKHDVLMGQIKNFLMSKYRYEKFEVIPEKHINEAIAHIMDIHDRRSIRDWKEQFEAGGYIEQILGAKQIKILKDII